MRSSSDHILTSHAGSLPRPDALIGAWAANDESALTQTLAAAVGDVVRRQKELGIDVPPDLQRELLPRLRIPPPAAFERRGHAVALRIVPGVFRPHTLIPGSRDAEPLVEAVVGRPAPFGSADVPFSVTRRGVTPGRQHIAHGPLPRDKATFDFTFDVPAGTEAVANGVETGHSTSGPRSTWTYEMTQPMATELTQLAVGNWDIRTQGRHNEYSHCEQGA